MRHLYRGRKLKRTSSHRKALLNSLATSLFEHKKLVTTLAKAKELRPFAESLITRAKHALANEKQGALPEGHKIDIHNRRQVARFIKNKGVIQELFDTIAPGVESRQGGYTRIVKLGFRRGDAGETALIELVDWSAPQDGAISKKSKRKTTKSAPKAKKQEVKKEVVEEAPVVAAATIVEEVAGAVEETPEVETNNNQEVIDEVNESNDANQAPADTSSDNTSSDTPTDSIDTSNN